MISDLNKQRFEYIWHLYYENKTDKDLPFADHIPCDPKVWQFPKALELYHDIVFKTMPEAFKDKTILDVGCGTAWYLGCMEDSVKHYKGIDIDDKNIKYAKIMSNNVAIDSSINLHSIETYDCRADTILMLSVTHELDNVEKALQRFNSEYLVMDSWEKFHGNHLNDHIDLLREKGYQLEHQTEWGDPPKEYKKRFILHFHRQHLKNPI